MSDPIVTAHNGFRSASDHLLIAFNQDEGKRFARLMMARDAICYALIPEAPAGKGEEWLVDTIANAIIDSTDYDCTAESQARYIVNELFKHLKPEDV